MPLNNKSCLGVNSLVKKLNQSSIVFITFFIKFYLSNKFEKKKVISSLSLFYVESFASSKSSFTYAVSNKLGKSYRNLFYKIFIKSFFFKKSFFLKFIMKSMLLICNSNYFKMSELRRLSLPNSYASLYYLTNSNLFRRDRKSVV